MWQVESTIHRQLYLAHDDLSGAGEKLDRTLREAIEEVLPAIRLFAKWVEQLEAVGDEEWCETKNPHAHKGLELTEGLLHAVQRTKLGEMSGVGLMERASATREQLKTVLGIAAPDRLRELQYDEQKKPEGRRTLVRYKNAAGKIVTLDLDLVQRTDFLDAVRWDRHAGVHMLRPERRDSTAGDFRRAQGRARGRPKTYRNEVNLVLNAVQLAPGGITIGAVAKALTMRKQLVTLAYKELVEDGLLRVERRGPYKQVWLFPNSRP